MITENGIRKLKKYCREPIEDIKGYKEAVESEEIYDCHHINELTFTKDELKKMNMYYHRPASELVIMTHSDHSRWHQKWNGNPMSGMTGEKNPMYGRTGEKCPMYGKTREDSHAWKGDNVGPSGAYKRARKLYKAGKISEEEFQLYRAAMNKYNKSMS